MISPKMRDEKTEKSVQNDPQDKRMGNKAMQGKSMKKLAVVINGKGGVGKDTLCKIASERFNVSVVSAITPIKNIARQFGWKGEKDKKSRRFLSELKRVFIEYNNLPNNFLIDEYNKFLRDNNLILFVHIRENDQIDLFKRSIEGKCVTLLIRRNQDEILEYGNYSDDSVEDYTYDYYYDNSVSLEETRKSFVVFLEQMLINEGII